jgi:outer membrane protein assembly factor BamB
MLSLELQAFRPEIEEQADFYPGCRQVVNKLDLVRLDQCPDSLDFGDDPAFDQYIGIEIADHHTVVEDPDRDLALEANARFAQFVSERLLVNGLKKPGAQNPMDFHGAADDRARQRFFLQAFSDRINRIDRIHTINNARMGKHTKKSSGIFRNPVSLVNPVTIAVLALAMTAPANWPSFRGPQAGGVVDGQGLPDKWNGATGENIKWKTTIPGLAHSSPVVWGDRLYVTSAISSQAGTTFRHGLYGDGDASKDLSSHRWMVYCIDKRSGKIVWDRTAFEGVPREKRHVKSTYANSTPATDGKHVVAFFGSQGLFCYDTKGQLLWKKDLGVLNVGAYDAPEYEWGTASSPIIHRDKVIVQCDTQNKDFLLALDIQTGETVWKAEREELPSWGTPTIVSGAGREELVTNASNFIRGYDPATGKELWRLGGSSKITAPTPIFTDDLIVVASGRRPEAPLFVIRAGASGDITLQGGQSSNGSIVWSRQQRGPYMPTPLIYQGLLYIISNQGILDSYELRSGKEIYRQRIFHQGGGFSASPVAADGRIYLSSEDGDVFVVKAGGNFELLATNPMGERLMATPALSEGTLFIRGEHTLFAVSAY